MDANSDTQNAFNERTMLARLEMTAGIVEAAVRANTVPRGEIAAFIAEVHGALEACASGQTTPATANKPPAVNPKKSVHEDYIICLEDGQKFKSLKRHLSTHYGLTPEEYRAKWGLPSDYPMVAPSYAAQRSALAKKMGLGRKPGPVKQAA